MIKDKPDSKRREDGDDVKSRNFKRKQDGSRTDGSAKYFSQAPYNFVPINQKIVKSLPIPPFDRYNSEKLKTGYIELQIKTETPLYIRDSLNTEDLEKQLQMEIPNRENKTAHRFINSDFFAPAGKIRIPGSSLRGMVSTLVEIVSYSRFRFFEGDRKFHYRALVDKSLDLSRKYEDQLRGGDYNKGYSPKAKAGYLVKDGNKFRIRPAKFLDGCQFFRVEEDDVLREHLIPPMSYFDSIKGKWKENLEYHMGFKNVYFKHTPPKTNRHSRNMFYAKVVEIRDAEKVSLQHSSFNLGALVCSGWMIGPGGSRGKHMHWVIGPSDKKNELEIPSDVLENYKNDHSRDPDANLFRYFKKKCLDIEVPCFFIEENGKVKSFGHTPFFRLAYEKKIGDLLPEEHRSFNDTDISESIFGNEKKFAGRVFFEDAFLKNNEEEIVANEAIPRILSTPKPTTFQHYLKQVSNEVKPEISRSGRFRGSWGIKDYNDKKSDTELAGYKLYWHKSKDSNYWREEKITISRSKFDELAEKYSLNPEHWPDHLKFSNNNVDIYLEDLKDTDLLMKVVREIILTLDTQHTFVKPMKTDSLFLGRIRFENLHPEELGALLFVLDLEETLRHKIGMGKPLGLGSIKIKPILHLSDRNKRYQSLFDQWEEDASLLTQEGEKISDFKKKFEKYVLKELQETSTTSLWGLDRMKELRRLLAFKQGPPPDCRPEDSKTTYIEKLTEFQMRKILPKATEVE